MFWFLLIALVVVVAAVTLAVIGGGDEAVLPEAEPERVADALPETRAVVREDIDALRLPVAPRGYRMAEVDDVLMRLGAELAERDKRIAELEAALPAPQAACAPQATPTPQAPQATPTPQAPQAPPAGPAAGPDAGPDAPSGSAAPSGPRLTKDAP
ncbi:DivIVA domain-containing protein [Streptomyces sp. NPDC090022]|uniref:DivIVA domain-containing protein n=1 Tax=Streptomyces sp. NPDC090022 TaxID=3365920 RepID=UPI0037FD1C14